PSRPDHACARQDRLPSRDPAPHVDAGITRLAFAGEKLLADRRADAVAGDRGAAADGVAWSAARLGRKMHADARLVLLDANAVMVGEKRLGAGARPERLQQHHLQVAAVDRELR